MNKDFQFVTKVTPADFIQKITAGERSLLLARNNAPRDDGLIRYHIDGGSCGGFVVIYTACEIEGDTPPYLNSRIDPAIIVAGSALMNCQPNMSDPEILVIGEEPRIMETKLPPNLPPGSGNP